MFKFYGVLGLSLLALGAAPISAQAAEYELMPNGAVMVQDPKVFELDDPEIDPEVQYANELKLVSGLGNAVLAKTIIGALTTVALFDRFDEMESDDRLRGAIVHLHGDTWRTYYIGLVSGTPMILYSMDYNRFGVRKRTGKAYENGHPLPDDIALMWRARQTSERALVAPCSQIYQSAVIPLATQDGNVQRFLVYAIPFSSEPREILIGGHYRIVVNASADSVIGSRNFGRPCVGVKWEKRKRPDLLVSIHPGAPYPEEPHVYLSGLFRMYFAVITTQNRYSWLVAGPEIKFLDVLDGDDTAQVNENSLVRPASFKEQGSYERREFQALDQKVKFSVLNKGHAPKEMPDINFWPGAHHPTSHQ